MDRRGWLFVLVMTMTACNGRPAGTDQSIQPPSDAAVEGTLPDGVAVDLGPPPCTPCTDPQACCTGSNLVCYGDPSTGIICTCIGVWTCDPGFSTCEQPLWAPDDGSWSCTWSKAEYVCAIPGSSSAPPGVWTDWTCSYDAPSSSWRCHTAFPPNPCNSAVGVPYWSCEVSAAGDKLVCTPGGGPPPPPPPPCSTGTWSCTTDSTGLEGCTRTDQTGLPAGGSGWRCHRAPIDTSSWICHGQASTNPQGAGWTCTAMGGSLYRCVQVADPCEHPEASATWQCVKGSAFGGTRCEKVPAGGCVPGQRRWCDGTTYTEWGQIECDASGQWKTKVVNGTTVLDCNETIAGGKIPDTLCACYHFFFSSYCCQREDCVLPKGTSGQVCPASAGNICDYCNPQELGQCAEAGALCVVTNSHETYCGKDCISTPCPTGYTCMSVQAKTGVVQQCVPSDMSCYY